VAWAAGLDSQLTYHFDSHYNVTWDDDVWRLPSTVDGYSEFSYDGTTTAGYNITTSEMGHLFYEELGNLGYFDTDGNTQSGFGLEYTGDFDNLIEDWYFSGTEYAANLNYVWVFNMSSAHQVTNYKIRNYHGLALRNSTVSSVPIPGAVWLLGTGLIGIAR